jgi:SOS response regulatory protein OraA/RecX
MPDVPADLTQFSAEEIINLQKENHARSTALRHRMRALLDSRLARKITKEEFDLERAVINEDVLACRQRGMALEDERFSRAYNSRGTRQRIPVSPA